MKMFKCYYCEKVVPWADVSTIFCTGKGALCMCKSCQKKALSDYAKNLKQKNKPQGVNKK